MSPSNACWHLKVLGPPQLLGPDGQPQRCDGKLLAALAFLALEGQATRTQLAGLLWPDTPEAGARNNLVHLLRRSEAQWGTALVQIGDVLRLAPIVTSDLHGEGEGELLRGVDWSAQPELQDWLLVQRERLNASRTARWRAQAQTLMDAGQLEDALSVTERLYHLNPASEDTLRRRMRLHYLLGRPAEALALYHEGAERLRTEFRTAPLPETQALARDIERGTALPPAAHTGTTPKSPLMNPTLVGREEQWARMEAAWAAGRGIVLSGPPGVGKTRLALDFLDAHGGGMRFQGRLGDAGLPYATHARTYRQVLEAYPHLNLDGAHLQELARILPHLGAPPAPIRDENEKFQFWQAKVQALQAAIAQGLRHMVFDDVQYMDDASIEAGGFVFAHLGWGDPAAPYRTIHIFRQGELSPFQQGLLDAMTAAGLVDLIEVGPLDEAATAQLVGQLQLPHRSGLAADLARYTGGNPLLLLEAARSLREAGDLPRLGGALPLPESAAQVTASRLARLSPAALQVARAAAVLGSDFDLELVAQVLGMPLLETAGAWEELEAAQVMRGSQFEHDLVAEVLLSSLSGAVRRLLHRTVARTLASGTAAPGRVARHWEAGGDAREAAPWFERAAQDAWSTYRTAEALAYGEAAATAYEATGQPELAGAVRQRMAGGGTPM